MASDHRRRTGLPVLLLVALVLLTVDYRQGQVGVVAALQRGAVIAFAPVQEGLAAVVRGASGVVGSVGELRAVRARNAQLEAEVDRLRQQRAAVEDVERENAELRAALDMRERLDVTTVGANVIAQPPNVFDDTVLLDIGADGGVAPGMAVVDAEGLVGRLVQVTARNARVQLLTSPEAHYAARIASSGEEGLLSGAGVRLLQLELLDLDVRIEQGETVVSHAFAGSAVPDGIPIGRVESSAGADDRVLSVRPFADLTRLSVVQVVLDAPQHPEQLPEDELVDPSEGRRPPPPDGTPQDDDEDDGEDDGADDDGGGEESAGG